MPRSAAALGDRRRTGRIDPHLEYARTALDDVLQVAGS